MLTKPFKTLLSALVVMVGAWSAAPPAMAQDLAVPTQIVNTYVASLLNGDTAQLVALMGERMKQKNRHVVLSPDSYSEFLKQHYAGVQTALENIESTGDKVTALVRFNHPNTDVTRIEFILDQVDGQWKVVGENTL